MTTLTAVTPAIVASNYTRDEIVREARRVFVNPSPLIQLMLHHLDRDIEAQSSTAEPAQGVNCCPTCGAQLTLHNETE